MIDLQPDRIEENHPTDVGGRRQPDPA